MSASPQLNNLVKLLSAESEEVRQAVREELRAFGPLLEGYMEDHHDVLSPEVQFQLHDIINGYKSAQMRVNWLDWTRLGSQCLQLESGLDFLARNQSDGGFNHSIIDLLDELARDFLLTGDDTSVAALTRFLFGGDRFRGCMADYYHPNNSNMGFVLTHGVGMPINLACVMILVGYRLGLDIKGFNMPGHFLARAREAGRFVLIDCYNGGRRLTESEIPVLSLTPQVNFQDLMTNPPSAPDIITRILVNLINAYHRAGSLKEHLMAQEFLADLRNFQLGNSNVPKSKGQSLFKPGQLVKHRNYGYRGVVVDYDLACKADEQWYRSNRSQPEKNQPWYHVLVDGSTVATYAAQKNLLSDTSGSEIKHPLISLYFKGFEDGSYCRNSVPWSF